ncbi:MAG TPA: rhodanese-like domain-containing protein [Propionicimonas sp.]|nr:rhodanese-like domain-containing protein [Propionicimonas sp.]HRA07708.1 rhodanese-like domain-containing protein [Propionicimonas sp.]
MSGRRYGGRTSRLAAGLIAFLAGASLLGGCSSASVSVSAGPTATAAPAAGSSLNAAEFAAAAKRPDSVLLDVRTAAEFAAGHLQGAVNIDVESPEFAAGIAGLDPSKTYAVYCRSANRSKVAMTAMQAAGFTSLYDLAGGINAWKSAGGEVVTG